MSLICPQCRGAFENISQCPKCGVPLADLGGQSATALKPAAWSTSGSRPEDKPEPGRTEKWHQSPSGRLLAALVLAVGMSYGMLRLGVTVLGFMGKGYEGALTPELGLGLFYGLQVPGLLLAGILTGVGRKTGAVRGALVGLISGILVLAFVHNNGPLGTLLAPFSSNLLNAGEPAHPILVSGFGVHQLTLLALPLVYTVCGFVGGGFGATVWKPPPEIALPPLAVSNQSPAAVGLKTRVNMPVEREHPSLISGPISWVRVLAGIGVAIGGGSFATRTVRDMTLRLFGDFFQISLNEQEFVTLAEIYALSILFGGMIAGATKPNGLKQGIIVGIGAGLGMVPFLSTGGGDQAKYLPFIVLSGMFIAPLGGWFGTTLLPPPPPPGVNRRFD